MWETDEAIIRGMKQKSSQAFKAFYDRYIHYVYNIVIGIVKNHHDALDLCQELFLEYFQKAHTYNPERGSVRAWIAVRARSRSVDYIRKHLKDMKFETLDGFDIESHQTPFDEVVQKDEAKQVVHSLLRLPEKQREAIVYNYYYSMSHKEISEKLNRPLGSVKSTIRYGINNLRKMFKESSDKERGDSIE